MGTTPSKPEAETTKPSLKDDYKWPSNLYVETRDMAAVSFLVYSFSYILDTARSLGGLKGLVVDNEGHATRSTASQRLQRSFTPGEVRALIEENLEALATKYPDEFLGLEVFNSLKLLEDRATESGMDRPLTLEEFDDKHQGHEMVYAVCKDSVNKRITITFRGTTNELAFGTNWTTNAYIKKTEAKVPDLLMGKVQGDSVWMHSGFYNYIFGRTYDPNDPADKTKYDEILEDVMPFLEANPDYKLYLTGHSLGAALSTVVAFFMACDDKVPKPVTCLNFASPRVGDSLFLEAVQELEKTNQLRLMRIVNDNDTIALVPMVNYYHAGFQVRLYKQVEGTEHYPPEITFPKIVDSTWNRWKRTWNNSLPVSLNLTYDHGEYRERVDQDEEFLRKEDLNELYDNSDLTGF